MFSNPRACTKAELRIFPSLRAYGDARVWNFSKSQPGPYKGGEFGIFPNPRDYMKAVLGIFLSPKAHINIGMPNSVYWHISSYSFIFLTPFFIFFTYSFIFTTSRNSWIRQGGGLYSQILKLPLGPDLEIFHVLRTFFRMWRHQGRGRGVLANPDIT